jgi:hypothetical protein
VGLRLLGHCCRPALRAAACAASRAERRPQAPPC